MIVHYSDNPKLNKPGTVKKHNYPFDSVLFFSDDDDERSTLNNGKFAYRLAGKDEDDFLRIWRIFYDFGPEDSKIRPVLEEMAFEFDLTVEECVDLLDETKDSYSFGLDGETGWRVQYYAAQAAKSVGYFGAQIHDENGVVMCADMYKKEKLLERIGD